MKTYIGTKTITATPAVRIDGKVYLPEDAMPKEGKREDGYKVKYEDGYESWSPKEVFEKAYRIAETPVDRIKIEVEDIMGRMDKLGAFFASEAFKALKRGAQAKLVAQYQIMGAYFGILASRHTDMEADYDGYPCGFTFEKILPLIREGYAVRRSGWNGKGLMVFKQVPASIDGTIIPGMQSLPTDAKEQIMKSTKHIDYTCQCLIFNSQTGRADSWVPSVSDIFANDWELVTD